MVSDTFTIYMLRRPEANADAREGSCKPGDWTRHKSRPSLLPSLTSHSPRPKYTSIRGCLLRKYGRSTSSIFRHSTPRMQSIFPSEMCRNLRHSQRFLLFKLRCHQPTQTHFSINKLWRSVVPPKRSLDVLSYPSNVRHALPEKSVLPHPPVILIQRQNTTKTPIFLPGQRNVPSQLPIKSAITFQQRL